MFVLHVHATTSDGVLTVFPEALRWSSPGKHQSRWGGVAVRTLNASTRRSAAVETASDVLMVDSD